MKRRILKYIASEKRRIKARLTQRQLRTIASIGTWLYLSIHIVVFIIIATTIFLASKAMVSNPVIYIGICILAVLVLAYVYVKTLTS